MKRPTNNSGTNNRVTRIGHLRRGQQQKKSKIKLCFLILVIVAIIFSFLIYLMASSLHRTVLEENEGFVYQSKQKKQKIQHPLNKEHIKQNHKLEMKQSSSKLFVTVVLPSVVNTRGRHKRLTSIAKTWGPDANAIYVIHDPNEYIITPSNTTEAATESSDSLLKSVTFPQTLHVPDSVATFDEGVPRLKYVMETIYENYNPDYIFFVNDHTYVIPQHICDFLNQHGNNHANVDNTDEQHYLYAGHALKPETAKYAFNSGAAGYFLSRDTMKGLIDHQRVSDSDTDNNSKNNSDNQNNVSVEKECRGTRKWLQGNPGLVTANCLKMTMHVDPTDTRDEFGRHVFHAYGIVRTVKGEFDSWYVKKHATLKDIWGEVSCRSVIHAIYAHLYSFMEILVIYLCFLHIPSRKCFIAFWNICNAFYHARCLFI